MNIGLFTDTYFPQINGVSTHVKTLKEGLEGIGHQVLVVTAVPKHRFITWRMVFFAARPLSLREFMVMVWHVSTAWTGSGFLTIFLWM